MLKKSSIVIAVLIGLMIISGIAYLYLNNKQTNQLIDNEEIGTLPTKASIPTATIAPKLTEKIGQTDKKITLKSLNSENDEGTVLLNYDLYYGDELIKSYRPDGGGESNFDVLLGKKDKAGNSYILEVSKGGDSGIAHVNILVQGFDIESNKLMEVDRFGINLADFSNYPVQEYYFNNICFEYIGFKDGFIRTLPNCNDKEFIKELENEIANFNEKMSLYF